MSPKRRLAFVLSVVVSVGSTVGACSALIAGAPGGLTVSFVLAAAASGGGALIIYLLPTIRQRLASAYQESYYSIFESDPFEESQISEFESEEFEPLSSAPPPPPIQHFQPKSLTSIIRNQLGVSDTGSIQVSKAHNAVPKSMENKKLWTEEEGKEMAAPIIELIKKKERKITLKADKGVPLPEQSRGLCQGASIDFIKKYFESPSTILSNARKLKEGLHLEGIKNQKMYSYSRDYIFNSNMKGSYAIRYKRLWNLFSLAYLDYSFKSASEEVFRLYGGSMLLNPREMYLFRVAREYFRSSRQIGFKEFMIERACLRQKNPSHQLELQAIDDFAYSDVIGRGGLAYQANGLKISILEKIRTHERLREAIKSADTGCYSINFFMNRSSGRVAGHSVVFIKQSPTSYIYYDPSHYTVLSQTGKIVSSSIEHKWGVTDSELEKLPPMTLVKIEKEI